MLSIASDEDLNKTCEEADDDKVHWLSSKETMRTLQISSCELMHKRERGELEFKKRGNSFLYNIPKKLSAQ